ncbi:MAG: acetate kinase, partial [Proteobacteria bacterium]
SLAVAVFVHRARKYVGALAASLGGVDAIVFTGGIGEHAAAVRAEICQGLTFFGATLDPAANAAKSTAERDVATTESRVRILVVGTDEERAIAVDTAELLGLRG